jgi:hypothetical protein
MVDLCNTFDEVELFSRFINNLELKNGDKFHAKRIRPNKEYRLQKTEVFKFEDLLLLDDRMIQKVLREAESQALTCALSESNDALTMKMRDKIYRNMSKRAAAMIKDDIEFAGPRNPEDITLAKQAIVEAYYCAKDYEEKGRTFTKSVITGYEENVANNNSDEENIVDYDRKKTSAVLTFRGKEDTPEYVSVSLFETESEAQNYRNFINKLKAGKDCFYYAKCVEQMVEYEVEKPILASFDKIFDCEEAVFTIALSKVNYGTLIEAIQGSDVGTREYVLNHLLPKYADEIRKGIDNINENNNIYSFCSNWRIKLAQEKILNVINSTAKKMKSSVFGCGGVIKD